MKTVAFVIPWYGLNISGGQENALRSLAEKLVLNEELQVEILTTCNKQFNSDWNENNYPQGIEVINGVKVRRFLVRKRNKKMFDKVNYKLMNNIPISQEEEDIFLQENINSPDLENYIRSHEKEYQCFFFAPYMFGTTYYGCQIVPEKSILLPALHDESYAFMQRFKQVFPKVCGAVYNSTAEYELANRIYELGNLKQEIIGYGISDNVVGDARQFIEKYKIKNPFIIYAGRKDHGKNVHLLLEYFSKLSPELEHLHLVLIGGGEINIPNNISYKVHDLGFLSIEEKYNAIAAAEILCQPSLHESFSLVMMEAWAMGTPTLVHGNCEVTRKFTQESNGGLYFTTLDEFRESTKLLLSNKEISGKLGNQGKKFVDEHFRWNTITAKYKDFIETL